MPYDPSKPVNGSPIVAAELRNQFAALNDATENLAANVGQLPSVSDVNDAIVANAAGPLNGLPPPDFIVSNPPTQAQVQAIADFVNSLYVFLSRT
jgi:hypothetical protein